MQVSGELFSTGVILTAGAVGALTLMQAARMAAWRRLFDNEQSHVFFGALVGMLVLWMLRTQVVDGLVFHLSAMTALTLMFGWSLAVVGGALVLAAITLAGLGDWAGYPVSLVLEVIVPATLTQVALVLVRAVLPRHFFIYIFVNAFLAAGVVGVVAAFCAAMALAASPAYSWQELSVTLFPFFPLMFFPEAFLNGWVMTLLVVFKPGWVGSFRDEDYLHGK